MLACLDALWSDFLRDVTTLQRAALTRSFSQLDPLDEFRLESGQVFARLLNDFRRQSAVALLGPVDLRVVEWHYSTSGGGVESTNMDKVGELLDDVAWLADWMEAKGDQNSEIAESTNGSSNGSSSESAYGSDTTNNALVSEPEPESTSMETLSSEYSASPNRTSNNGFIDPELVSALSESDQAALFDKLMNKLGQVSGDELSEGIKKLENEYKKKGKM